MSQTILPESWIRLKLGDLCLPIKNVDFSKRKSNSIRYIDISSIDRDQKKITYADIVDNINAPSRARLVVKQNDVIVSTVRPVLNTVAIVPEHLDDEVCSTGFCVLRANPRFLDAEYLFAWVRSSEFIQSLTRVERGIGYPAVSNNDVENTQIPLPPLPEQRRIAAILREADEIGKLRQQANEKTQKIVEALFYDMFGDPVRPIVGKVKETLGDFVNITSSLVDPTKKEYEKFVHVGSDNIESRTGNLVSLQSIKDVGAISGKFLFTDKNVLYSKIRPVLRKVATPDFVGLCSADIYPLEYDKNYVRKLFLAQLLRSNDFTNYTIRVSGRAQIPKINREDLLHYQTFLPDIELQEEFVLRSQNIILVHLLHDKTDYKITTLYQSLLAQAFSGDLTLSWRESHIAELEQAAEERDDLLKGLDVATKALPPQKRHKSQVTNRTELTKGLTRLQTALLALIEEQDDTYFTATRVHGDIWLHMDEQGMYQEELDREGRYTLFAGLDCSLDTTRRELHFLARMGLVKELTLPVEEESGIGIVHYITAYRSLRDDDDCQQQDLGLLNPDQMEEALT